ncbi:hypothetical protein [uncultured Bradyrhizobium sp.]|uniref:hypothetical protein n=1 Tax=uncultured Bradyrhizobium sp. TaxID=199684 RepID=UPI002637A1A2|nr:hypothetical protein [uncultured Bradyrhizobium sp.]
MSVRTQFIRPNEAQIGASADGPVNSLEEHTSGDQIPLYRQDCDRLIVTIKDTSFEIKGGLTLEQVQKLGPAGGMLVDRKVVGSISGKCEE